MDKVRLLIRICGLSIDKDTGTVLRIDKDNGQTIDKNLWSEY